jgi:hypothetical protein
VVDVDVELHWRGSATDFVTDLIAGALSRRDLVAVRLELDRRGYGVPHGIPWADGGDVTESAAPPTVVDPRFSAGHAVIRKLRIFSGESGGEAELTAIDRLESAEATATDVERLAPIARDAGLPWEKMYPELRVEEPPVPCSVCELVHASDVTCGQAMARDVDRRLREPMPNPITSVAARDFTLAGPCPALCSCDERQAGGVATAAARQPGISGA